MYSLNGLHNKEMVCLKINATPKPLYKTVFVINTVFTSFFKALERIHGVFLNCTEKKSSDSELIIQGKDYIYNFKKDSSRCKTSKKQ